MRQDHPTLDDFTALFRSAPRPLHASRRALATRHLLAGCPSCRERLRAAGWEERRLDRLVSLSATGVRESAEADAESTPAEHGFANDDYAGVFSGAERSLAAFCGHDAPLEVSPEGLLRELARLSEAEQARSVREDPRFAHPEVVRSLIDQSHLVRYEDPRKMVHFADLARLAAVACAPASAGNEARLADLRARGWMQYGNALRVCGDLPGADEALTRAQQLRDAGTRDPLLRARLLEHLASLRTFQGRFQNAMEMADGAAEVYRELGEHRSLASTMVQKAIAALSMGQTEEAIRILNRAVPKIDPEENPQLLLAACHNLIRCYIDLDRPEQALSLYFETRDLYQGFGDSLILLRTGWQEGQLLRDLGHLGAAETALLRARQGFLERGLALEVALVSLDLASVYVRTGKVEDLRRTAAEAVPIFRALHVGREAIGSLLQLQQAAGQEKQALELIRRLNTRLAPLSQNAAIK
jgi:tetratricopeptide (TPR) repeat protein